MRMLGVDFGSKRIGLAVGESGMRIATPRPNLPASGTLAKDAETLAQVVQREKAELVVVGLPLDEGGQPTAMSRVCAQLAARIAELGLPVATVDEAMTSVDSDTAMRSANLKASERRKRRDGEAACRILERYWSGAQEV